MTVISRNPIHRFEEKYRKSESGCWEWFGAKKAAGYGNFMMKKGFIVSAHRASWVFYRGPIPDGLHICHRCDNPCCVNPDHLFPGTCKENHDDMHRKGRARGIPAGGESHPGHRLSDVQVLEIRAHRNSGMFLKDIAKEFNTTESNVSVICSGKSRRKLAAEAVTVFDVRFSERDWTKHH